MIRLDIRVVRALLAVVVAVVVVAGIAFASSAFAPTSVATAAELDGQRAAAERAIQRISAAGVDQLRTTRGLRLAITDAQAAQIERKYADQLRTLRHDALVAIAVAFGQSADQSAQYATQTESRIETIATASAAPVMLAPRLYAIVEKMGQLAGQVSDQGIREMTQTTPASPTAAPSSTPRTTPTASPSPTR